MIDITPEDSVVPVFLVPLTDEENAEREQLEIESQSQEQAILDRIAAKESALSKLAALGLTEEEAKAIVGV